jgi:hypothetical protein
MAGDERTPPERKSHGKSPSSPRLDRMIAEAVVDAYGESEQIIGFCTMLEDNLVVPFDTEILGVEVTVQGSDMSDYEQIVAGCSRGRSGQRVPILNLPLPAIHPTVRHFAHSASPWGGQNFWNLCGHHFWNPQAARLYYRFYMGTMVGDKYLCVVVKIMGEKAFVLTAYLTDRMKRGVLLWPKRI